MRLKLYIGLLIFLAVFLHIEAFSQKRSYQFVNGNWFNGQGFENKAVYTVEGKLSFNAPNKVDSVIDLKDKFVVPPYGEAHNHNIEYNLSLIHI